MIKKLAAPAVFIFLMIACHYSRQYVSKECSFSIMFPGAPKHVTTIEDPVSSGNVTRHHFEVRYGLNPFLLGKRYNWEVIYRDLRNTETPDSVIPLIKSRVYALKGCKIEEDIPLTVQGYQAHQFKMVYPGTLMWFRLIVVGQHIYSLRFTTHNMTYPREKVQAYFESFQVMYDNK